MSNDERTTPAEPEELDADALGDVSGGTPGWVSPKPTVVTPNG